MIYVMGGGGGINYRVFNGLTAPSNPKDSDIWVKTDTTISQFIFNKFPTAWTTTSGSVNFTYESSSDYSRGTPTLFKTGKFNGRVWQHFMQLTGAYQSDGTRLIKRDAYVFNSTTAQWVQFSSTQKYLIENGTAKQTFTANSASVGQSDGYLYVTKLSGYDPGASTYYTTVDLTDYNTLYIDGFNRGNDYDVHAYVKVQSADGATTKAQVQLPTSRTTATIDVSAITGNCRILLESQAHLFNYDTGQYRVSEPAIYNLYLV